MALMIRLDIDDFVYLVVVPHGIKVSNQLALGSVLNPVS
jgi:hypothetical protein